MYDIINKTNEPSPCLPCLPLGNFVGNIVSNIADEALGIAWNVLVDNRDRTSTSTPCG